MCIKGGLSAPIAPRFAGPKAQALVALLIYLGPLLRGWERLRWRLKALPPLAPIDATPPQQRGRLAWRERAFVLSYWSESGIEKEVVIGALMRGLADEKYPTALGTGWDDWDLRIDGNLAGSARVAVATENHGADKRLLRARCALRLSPPARWVIGVPALATPVSLFAGSTVTAVILFFLTVVACGFAGWQLAVFGGRLHRLIEAAARESQLAPVETIEPPTSGPGGAQR
jgi:hypothetical protein